MSHLDRAIGDESAHESERVIAASSDPSRCAFLTEARFGRAKGLSQTCKAAAGLRPAVFRARQLVTVSQMLRVVRTIDGANLTGNPSVLLLARRHLRSHWRPKESGAVLPEGVRAHQLSDLSLPISDRVQTGGAAAASQVIRN